MDCVTAADLLLADEPTLDAELERHVQDCHRCAHLAAGLERVDSVLASTLLVAPPVELQQRLAELALQAARPSAEPWWRRAFTVNLSGWWARPQMVAAQGLATLMLALASWQIFGWLTSVRPVVGDVGYAMALVVGSPAVSYLGTIQVDLQSLGLWSVVGLVGWLVSENGPIGRRIAAGRLRLP